MRYSTHGTGGSSRWHARLGAAASVLALAALMARPATAGIVNVQSVLSSEAEEGVSGSVTGAMDWRTGTVDRLVFSLAPVVRYRTGDHLFLAYGSTEYDDSADIAKVFGHVRYRYALSERITGEVFTQSEYDEKRALTLRTLAGAGPLFHLFEQDDLRLSWGVAYMLEYEEINEAKATRTPEVTGLQHRVSSYLTGSYALADKLQLVETIYVQPLITGPSNVRLHNDSSIVISLSKQLSFNTTFSLSYDTDPPYETDDPPSAAELDTALKSSITYQF